MSSKIRTAVEAANPISVSTGTWASPNLNFSVSDVSAAMTRQHTAVEPAVWVVQRRQTNVDKQSDKFVARERFAIPQNQNQNSLLTTDSLGWDLSFTDRIRSSLRSFAEDWNDPAMDVYDEP